MEHWTAGLSAGVRASQHAGPAGAPALLHEELCCTETFNFSPSTYRNRLLNQDSDHGTVGTNHARLFEEAGAELSPPTKPASSGGRTNNFACLSGFGLSPGAHFSPVYGVCFQDESDEIGSWK